MKSWLKLLLVGTLGVAVAWWFTARQAARVLAAETARQAALAAAWEAERAQLESALAVARSAPSTPAVHTTGATPVLTVAPAPAVTMARLRQLRPGAGVNRIALRRQVIHQLGHLADAGPAAIPVIREFLVRMEDLEYEPGGEGTTNRVGSLAAGLRGRPRAPLDFEFPPTLRLGLVDVLLEIGGFEAETVLAEMLETTGRGVEVAYVARALQRLAPDEHRAAAVAVATELLAHPPVIEQPTRLDRNAQDYLYQVLRMFHDTSFAGTAQGLLVSAEGRVDRDALGYLNGALKEQAMPAIYQAYQDPRLTNQWEKAALVGTAFGYVGPNAQANQMFQDVLAATNIPAPLKALAVASLVGTDQGGFTVERPAEPRMIDARIQLLQSLQAGTEDAQVRGAMERTVENLNRIREGREPANPALDFRQWLRGNFGLGSPAGGRN